MVDFPHWKVGQISKTPTENIRRRIKKSHILSKISYILSAECRVKDMCSIDCDVWIMPLTSSLGFLNEKDYNSQVTMESRRANIFLLTTKKGS